MRSTRHRPADPCAAEVPGFDPVLDADYDARATVEATDFTATMARYRSASEEAVAGLAGHRGIVYDRPSGRSLDVWGVSDTPRPVVLMVHGGYWRMLSRHDTAFMARILDAAGIATVAVDYGLAPATALPEIVRQVRAAVAWIHLRGRGYGLDPARLVVAGSSAGAHLAAMTMVDGWHDDFGIPAGAVRAGLLLSGLYELDPLRRTRVQTWLSLTARQAAESSPLRVVADERRAPADRPAAVIVRAEHEAPGFHRQSARFHRAWAALAPSRELIVPGRNHFDVFLDLAHADTAPTAALLDLVAQTAPHPDDES